MYYSNSLLCFHFIFFLKELIRNETKLKIVLCAYRK